MEIGYTGTLGLATRGSEAFGLANVKHCRAITSNPDTPMSVAPVVHASALAVAMPMRSPVNDPGPRTTPMSSASPGVHPRLAATSVSAGAIRRAWALTPGRNCWATRPSERAATEPAGRLESMASVFMGSGRLGQCLTDVSTVRRLTGCSDRLQASFSQPASRAIVRDEPSLDQRFGPDENRV